MSDASNSNQKSSHISKPKPLGLEIWNSSRICEYVDERENTHRREIISHRDLLQLARNAAKFVWLRYPWARRHPEVQSNQFDREEVFSLRISHEAISRYVTIVLLTREEFSSQIENRRQSNFAVEFRDHWLRLLSQSTR